MRSASRTCLMSDFATKVMTGSHAQTEGELHELRLELRDLLTRMQIEDIKEQQKVLVLQVAQDPSALERYRALAEKRKELEQIAPKTT